MAPRFLNAYTDWYIGSSSLIRLHTRPRAEGLPRTHVKAVRGARSLPEADDSGADMPVGRMGEDAYPRTTRGKTITYELQQQAGTEPDLNTSMAALESSFQDRSSVGLLIVEPWSGHGTDIWATFARVLDFDCDEDLVYAADANQFGHFGPWRLDPTLSFRQRDGRWFWWNESGTPATSMEWDDTTAVVVTNSGNAPTDPIITVAGVADGDDVHIGRDAAGGYPAQDLWFRGLQVTGAGNLQVDFPSRVALLDGVDVSETYDASSSDWWDEYVPGIPPGAFNVWRGPGAGTHITVGFFSASW